MRLPLSGVILAFVSFGAFARASPADDVAAYVKVYEDSVHELSRGEDFGPRCSRKNVRVRRSWYNLSEEHQLEYIEAVKCLQKKPARTPLSFAPGARNRIDDYTASHINQTLTVHFSCKGWFLAWHRWFLWQWETDLREQCGYSGAQPYWNWTEYSHDYTQDPLLDGSETSLGGNGEFVPHEAVNNTIPGLPEPFFVFRDRGTGFGCVTDGPFVNLTLHLGQKFPYGDRDATGLEYNPHCLTRNFNQQRAEQALTDENVATLLSQASLADFRAVMDPGVHAAGHESVGGDVGDVFTSPQDPLFFFHHAQLDRLWAVWQQQDPQRRIRAVADTITFANIPPSRKARLSDALQFGYVGGSIQMSQIVDPLDGLLCYRYE